MPKLNSEIENAINNLEIYIEGAKSKAFDPNKIIVKKDDMEYFISELRNTIPEEVERYRKIISNKEAIEREAQERADAMLDDVEKKANQVLSDTEIMQRANEQADEIVNLAVQKAQEIINEAQIESNNYKTAAQNYLNDMLVNLQGLIYDCIDNTAANTNKFLDSLNQFGLKVSSNLDSLNGVEEADVSNEATGEVNTEE